VITSQNNALDFCLAGSSWLMFEVQEHFAMSQADETASHGKGELA
jgi:hypothetical protein